MRYIFLLEEGTKPWKPEDLVGVVLVGTLGTLFAAAATAPFQDWQDEVYYGGRSLGAL